MAAIVLFCLALLVCIVLRANILYALLAGLVIFALYGKKQSFSWKDNNRCAGTQRSAMIPSTAGINRDTTPCMA